MLVLEVVNRPFCMVNMFPRPTMREYKSNTSRVRGGSVSKLICLSLVALGSALIETIFIRPQFIEARSVRPHFKHNRQPCIHRGPDAEGLMEHQITVIESR